ncbi:hypothetical protein PHYSODRAFT_566275 [Phytophthora sojae]|uniref:protein-serine/threonine phosphatase n=1 Tax=Phytophthora sojae (strain P6497) TaxID=1094619 RepID=G5AEV8_PHYSP|nr:hypothetical protein PHYSODRAFT_566275 [Phytophthora sojae]EGZ05748.1 hypothetical protein PHYSODRAFT_566275 [Phytophthora sojae]|eukprot:XP_009538609.1 hypothetical protein PHYSODRAFT_566275 [Phytophthora sojae]
MAANGVKREDAASIKAEEAVDEAQVKLEADENKDSVKAEADGAPDVKTEAAAASEGEPKEAQVKQENGRVKAEDAPSGVKIEEKIKKQELEEVAAAAEAAGDVKQAAKRDVKKDEGPRQQQQEQEDRSHIRRKGVQCDAALWDSIDWVVAAGAEVDAGQRLGTAGRLELGNQRPMQAPCKGRLYILTKEQSDEIMRDTKDAAVRTVAFVEYCIHRVRNGRTCLMCLAVVDEDEENEDMESVNVVSHGQVIRLNVEEAKKFDSDNIRRQLGAKKLSLVLDLDHTLLHAVRVDDVVGEIPKSGMLSALYDLFIYTHGTRLYAEQIVKIIDPDESYFKNRIVARTDTPDMLHKSLKLLFPSCDDSMILVLDDRIDVWKENEGNVFLIEPYHYFKCTSEINNASGRGHVHETFYAGHETGMRDLGAKPSMTLNNFPLTHLVIHPERLGTQKHVQAKKIPGVLIVTPDWIIKCARSWSRVSEQDFLADQWKAKHKKPEPEKQPDANGATSSSDTGEPSESKTPSAEIKTDADSSNPTPVSAPASEGKTVSSILVKRGPGDAKPATKREPPRASVKAKKVEEAKKTPARSSSPPKDVDDAFLRLIEAEERESKEEEKRKQSSTDIKDQLFSRRTKNDSAKRAHEADGATAESGEKRLRVTPSEQQNDGAEDAEEEEEELDDLEADILGDL